MIDHVGRDADIAPAIWRARLSRFSRVPLASVHGRPSRVLAAVAVALGLAVGDAPVIQAQRCATPWAGCTVFQEGRGYRYTCPANVCATALGWCHLPQTTPVTNTPCACLTLQNQQVPGRTLLFPNADAPSPYLRQHTAPLEFCR